MEDKKAKNNKKVASASKSKPKAQVQPTGTAKPEKVEQKVFAKDLARKLGVPTFDYFIIKRQEGIDDTTPLSVSEFKNMYQKILEGR